MVGRAWGCMWWGGGLDSLVYVNSSVFKGFVLLLSDLLFRSSKTYLDLLLLNTRQLYEAIRVFLHLSFTGEIFNISNDP